MYFPSDYFIYSLERRLRQILTNTTVKNFYKLCVQPSVVAPWIAKSNKGRVHDIEIILTGIIKI